jgi:ataxia telangiectasia mutated family protein
VPLSPDSGILQWVENTIPIGEFLIPRRQVQSAHTRYFPGEWSQNLCRNHITHAPDELKRAAFDEICKHFSPAFRFFFLERFSHSPQQWHTARMTYTRSCAVNSFVGHVLGIGDRHLGNILIHERTGELVHIDFGYVFDQAKVSFSILYTNIEIWLELISLFCIICIIATSMPRNNPISIDKRYN